MYSLLDSGAGRKLERFGPRVLIRPSSLCIWQPRQPTQLWKSADAEYIPKEGWQFSGAKLADNWSMVTEFGSYELRLQKNGQTGFFPEHTLVIQKILAISGNELVGTRVLNLFGYTGLASVALARLGASITHVDIAKHTLSWVKENFRVNQIPEERLRVIEEDAIRFIEREVKRGAKYDIIIADPPSFSRVSKMKTWDLEQVAEQMCKLSVDLLARPGDPTVDKSTSLVPFFQTNGGLLALSTHSQNIPAQVLRNLLYDLFEPSGTVELFDLTIPEANSRRAIPAGSCLIAICNDSMQAGSLRSHAP